MGNEMKNKLTPPSVVISLAAAIRGFSTAVSLVLLGIGTSACAIGGASWKEEVLLHDGNRIIVQRSQTYGGRTEPGKSAPIREETISFKLPGTRDTLSWVSEYSEDVGRANFNLLALHVSQGTPYLVVSPNLCLSYNKWGRPNPPYILFKFDGKEWRRIPLAELPPEFKDINLVINTKREEEIGRLSSKTGFVTAEGVRQINASLTQPEYKTILREAVKGYGNSCPAMISYGKSGGWIGLDWFTQQPTLDACMKVCDREKISAENCPCNSIFKGK